MVSGRPGAAVVLGHVDVIKAHLLDDALEPVEFAGRQFDRVGVEVAFKRLHFLAYEALDGLRDHALFFGHQDFHDMPPSAARWLNGL